MIMTETSLCCFFTSRLYGASKGLTTDLSVILNYGISLAATNDFIIDGKVLLKIWHFYQ